MSVNFDSMRCSLPAAWGSDIVLRVDFVSGRAPMELFWGQEGRRALDFDLRKDFRFYTLPVYGSLVMDWSCDGPFTFNQHRWILFGPFETTLEAKEYAQTFDLNLVKGWQVYPLWHHVGYWHLKRRMYTDG